MNRKCLHDGIHLPQYISPPNNTCSEVCLILFEIITQNYIVALSLGTPVCLSIGFYWMACVAKTKSEREKFKKTEHAAKLSGVCFYLWV